MMEMMVAVVIAGVLVAGAIPALRNFRLTEAVGAQVSELTSAIHLARSEAIRRMTPVSICTSSNPNATSPTCSGANTWQSGWVVFVDLNSNGTIDATDRVLRVHDPLGRIGTVIEAAGVTFFTFRPNGVVAQGNVSLVFSPDMTQTTSDVYLKNQRTVCLRASGRLYSAYQNITCS